MSKLEIELVVTVVSLLVILVLLVRFIIVQAREIKRLSTETKVIALFLRSKVNESGEGIATVSSDANPIFFCKALHRWRFVAESYYRESLQQADKKFFAEHLRSINNVKDVGSRILLQDIFSDAVKELNGSSLADWYSYLLERVFHHDIKKDTAEFAKEFILSVVFLGGDNNLPKEFWRGLEKKIPYSSDGNTANSDFAYVLLGEIAILRPRFVQAGMGVRE